jgi:hypothetical protein
MDRYDEHCEGGDGQNPEMQGTVDFLLEWKEQEPPPGSEETQDSQERADCPQELQEDPAHSEATDEESFMVSREAHHFLSPDESGEMAPESTHEFTAAPPPPPPPEREGPATTGDGGPQGAETITRRNPWEALSGLIDKGKSSSSPPSHPGEKKTSFPEAQEATQSTCTSSLPASSPVGPGKVHAASASEPRQEEGGDECFEWTAERHRAIEEALREATDIRLPTVHSQLQGLQRSLQNGQITKERALAHLAEVEQYLNGRVEGQRKMVTVAHEAIISARADLLKGLQAYQESANSLREFVMTGEQVHLDLSAYTADQATSFVAIARKTILEVQPEAPAEQFHEAKSR